MAATRMRTPRESLKAWFRAHPTGAAVRHQMPNFKLSEQDLENMIYVLRWTSEIDLQGWPPKKAK